MANPPNTTNLTVRESTYNRLAKIRETHNYTFNQVINQLCEKELQTNYISKVTEYELITETTTRQFKVTFRKENILIEYYTPQGFSTKIEDWKLDKKTTNKFYEFTRTEYARCMLENMPISIEFEDFIIHKIG